MKISLDNLTSILAAETRKLAEADAVETKFTMVSGHEITVIMTRILIADEPASPYMQRSGHKAVKDKAEVSINPPNEELCEVITQYFLSEKIPAGMGAPARLFFDAVLINNKTFIPD